MNRLSRSISHWLCTVSLFLPILIALGGCQSRASTPVPAARISSTPSPNVCPTTNEGIIEPQCQALVAIYQKMDGESWQSGVDWLSNQPICTWNGVTCSGTNVVKLWIPEHLKGELPPEIGQLISLQELDLGINELTKLPPEMGQLTHLRKLDLSGNQFSELPPEIWQLTSLQELKLNMNRLTELPPEIGQLTNLQELDLRDNQIMELPPEFGRLTRLQELWLWHNPLSTLPSELGQLTNLRELRLEGTSVLELPVEVCLLPELEVYPPDVCAD